MKNGLHKSTNLVLTGSLLALTFGARAAQNPSPTTDPVLDILMEKGIITADEAVKVETEIAARQSNLVAQATAAEAAEVAEMPASKWKINDAIKNLQLFGDVRLRYEYRAADNSPGAEPNTYYRERFRYALRLGVRGDLTDDFNYGLRLETSTNPRSPWDTFGSNGTAGSATPSDKSGSGIGIGQIYIGWHPTSWYEMTVGRMPMPLYTTPMVWDSDINPEGAFEKFKYSAGKVDLFADFAQFDYQDPSEATESLSSDIFVLAWQLGANVNLTKDMSFKAAPMLYTYTGRGNSSGLNEPFVGQGDAGLNVGVPGGSNMAGYNEEGINDLLILEVPAEFDFKLNRTPLGPLQARLFGDFAYNFKGDDRARAAFNANPGAFPGLTGPVYGQDEAFQAGIGIGSMGPVYGPTQGFVYGSMAKKHDWEARFYWQHVEQYSLDVNLLDSDFFEGRGNEQGFYSAFAYCFTDAVIGTFRYGYATPITSSLGTGGNNLDMPGLNPIKNYNVAQMDLTWKF